MKQIADLRMTRHRSIAISALCVIVAGFILSPVIACPFCLSPPQTFAEQMDRADLVLIAELVRFRVLDHGTRAESTLRIREYLRGEDLARDHSELTMGQCLVVDKDFSAKTGDLFLMYGDLPEFDSPAASTFAVADDSTASPVQRADYRSDSDSTARRIAQTSLMIPAFIAWNDSTAVTPAAIDYLRSLPAVDLPQQERLPFYLSYLEHADPALAIDAWAEFANSTYAEVVAVRELMSRDKLRSWIADPLASPDRLGLYGMMLGLCGEHEDAEFLRQQMQPTSSDEFRFGADGLMGGYLLLAREAGLAELERSCVNVARPRVDSLYAMVQALSFMESYEPGLIRAERLRESMRLFLNHEGLREPVTLHLARWQDWDALPLLIDMFDCCCADDPMSRRAIVQFASVCAMSKGTTPHDEGLRESASEFLAVVRRSDPGLVE